MATRPLAATLHEVFAAVVREGQAGRVTEARRVALAAARARFTLGELREAYAMLLRSMWGDVIDDDALDEGEVRALDLIVTTLDLPRSWRPQRRGLALAV